MTPSSTRGARTVNALTIAGVIPQNRPRGLRVAGADANSSWRIIKPWASISFGLFSLPGQLTRRDTGTVAAKVTQNNGFVGLHCRL